MEQNRAKKDGDGIEKKKISQRRRTQFLACCSVQTVGILAGLALAHSSSLIPQLESPESDIPLDRYQSAWIASVVTLTLPIGSLFSGWLVDTLGRLAAVRLATIPYVVSCAVVATAQSFQQLVAGRLLLGFSLGIGMNSCLLYTTEVAEKEIRGNLGCLWTAIASLGILIGYAVGALLSWRAAAWTFCASPALLLGLLHAFAAESPAWLKERGREEAAREASMYFYGDPTMVLSVSKSSSPLTLSEKFKFLLTKPAGLKPFLFINFLFIFQNLVGIYITLSYAVTFFQESGSDWNPYLASVLLGMVRLLSVAGASLSAERVGKRPLMVGSTLGMGACMLTGATAILWKADWGPQVVPVAIVLYMAFAGAGMQTIPWAMMAEVFPHEVRSVAHAINMAATHLFQFMLLQLYPTISDWLGGAAGVQLLFACSSFLAALYCWLFLVETRGRTLSEIEDYFAENIIYPGHKQRRKLEQKRKHPEKTVSTVC